MHEIIHPPGWAPAKGYANGMLAEGKTLFIGGQIGWNAAQVFEHHDFIGQMEQALANIAAVLAAGGARPEHLVRMTWFVTDKAEYLANQRGVGEAYRRILGRHFPAMTMVIVAGLVEDEALLEIEATAVIPHG